MKYEIENLEENWESSAKQAKITWNSAGSYTPIPSYLDTHNIHLNFNTSSAPMLYEEYQPGENDRKFIRLEKALKKQWQEFKDVYSKEDYEYFKQAMQQSVPLLLGLSPDKISLQLSYDKSIFYTLIKNDISIYFDHFVQLEDDMDEVIVSVYQKKEKIFSLSSSLEHINLEINQFLFGEPYPSLISKNELSC